MVSGEHELKDRSTLKIREARPEDAADLLAYLHDISGESDFLSFGPGELDLTEEQEADFLRKCLVADNQIYFLGRVDGLIVASMHFGGGNRPRLRHTGEFGMAVRSSHWSLGVGSILLDVLLDWARSTGVVRKINLRVRSDNHRAIRLYERKGFALEGTLSRDTLVDGEFFDGLCMGLEL